MGLSRKRIAQLAVGFAIATACAAQPSNEALEARVARLERLLSEREPALDAGTSLSAPVDAGLDLRDTSGDTVMDETNPNFQVCNTEAERDCRNSPPQFTNSDSPDGGLAWGKVMTADPLSPMGRECVRARRENCLRRAIRQKDQRDLNAWLDQQLGSVDAAFTQYVRTKLKLNRTKADVVCTTQFCRFKMPPDEIDAGPGVVQFVPGASNALVTPNVPYVYVARPGYLFPGNAGTWHGEWGR